MYLLIKLQTILVGIFSIILLVYWIILDVELLKVLPSLILILLLVALFTLFERKILGGIQRRRGPNVVGIWGILQPFADALKLIFRETIIPVLSKLILFLKMYVFELKGIILIRIYKRIRIINRKKIIRRYSIYGYQYNYNKLKLIKNKKKIYRNESCTNMYNSER